MINNFFFYKINDIQPIVGSVVIDAKLGRENHDSIPWIYDWEEAETT
jgi:hypothetical protein